MGTTFGNDTPKTIFQDERPDVIRLEDVYDPDTGKGSITPSMQSILIDHKDSGALYYVTSIDARRKVSYLPCKIVYTMEEGNTSIIDYNNSRFAVFYDDRVKPTKLNIDSLLVFYGSENDSYRLIRKDNYGKPQVISMYYDSDGTYKGELIPLRDVPNKKGIKYPTNCHTTVKIEDNELVTMEVFDSTGVMKATITLFTNRATVITDNASAPIITKMALTGTQIKDGKFYLYEKQDISNLNIQPEVHYSNGSIEVVPIDNQRCFLYGYEDAIAASPGIVNKLLCKYYLRSDQVSQSAIDSGNGRYEVAERDIVVVSNNTIFGSKVSVIPEWNNNTKSYSLKFFLYSSKRDTVLDVTESTTILSENLNTGIFGDYQKVSISVDMQKVLNLKKESYHVQQFYILFNHYFQNTSVPYLIKDTKDGKVFGMNSATISRLVLHYDKVKGIYFVPTSIIGNVEALLDTGYKTLDVPYDTEVEASAPYPTHFTLRDPVTSKPIIAEPIPLKEYKQKLIPILKPDEMADKYANKTVVLEWLVELDSGYGILYGVPVDVSISSTGYM